VAAGEHEQVTGGSLGAAEAQDRPAGGHPPAAARDTGTIGDPLAITVFGDRALLVEPPDRHSPGTPWVLRVAARARRRWPSATVVPGLANVLVAFERPSDRPDPRGPEAQTVLSGHTWAGSTSFPVVVDLVDPPDRIDDHQPPPARLHALPTRYDGPDLADVATMLRLPAAEVVRRHAEAVWTVAAIGFSPGFGYLTTADPLFAGVMRRPDPRPRVPRGSVALAAGMCAVYPSATPGGWQLIATTATELFDVHAEHPAVLRVGDRVTFLEVP
jgi:allophanate hydrolase subunit 1